MKNTVLNELKKLNKITLNLDEDNWGKIKEEEAEEIYNNIDHELHDEIGTKSLNILYYIKALK